MIGPIDSPRQDCDLSCLNLSWHKHYDIAITWCAKYYFISLSQQKQICETAEVYAFDMHHAFTNGTCAFNIISLENMNHAVWIAEPFD